MRITRVAPVLAASTLLIGGAASSQTVGTLDLSDPRTDGVFCSDVNVSVCQLVSDLTASNGDNEPFDAYTLEITDGSSFLVDLNRLPGDFVDTDITVYSSFDPANPLADIVAYNDDFGSLDPGINETNTALVIGTYVLVISPLVAMDTVTEFSYELDVINAIISAFSFGPSSEEELANALAASGGAARLLVIGADGVARQAGLMSLATRDGQISLTRVADGAEADNVTVSSMSAPGMMGNLYTWVEVTGFRSNDFGTGSGSLTGGGLQIGADLPLSPNAVAGVSLGYTQIDTSDAGTTTESDITYLQPYFAYRSGDWHGNASLIYGRGDIDQSSAGGPGAADLTLAALTFEGGRDYSLSDTLTLTPTLGFIHGEQEAEGNSGTLAGSSDTVRFTQGSIGARLSSESANGVLFAGLHADYLSQDADTQLALDLLADDGWTGRVEFGFERRSNHGTGLRTSLGIRGLGGDMQTMSGELSFSISF